MREFFSNAWNMSHPQSWYVLFPVRRHRYISDSTVSGLRIFHDVPTFISYKVGNYHLVGGVVFENNIVDDMVRNY
jgi:hypothetical protein